MRSFAVAVVSVLVTLLVTGYLELEYHGCDRVIPVEKYD